MKRKKSERVFLPKVFILGCLVLLVLAMVPSFAEAAVKKKASLKLSKSSVTLYAGSGITLKATLKNRKGTIRWSTSDSKVASVSTKGKITAKKAGTAVITASVSGLKASCRVKVKKVTELSGYYRKPYSSVMKKFKGGTEITDYAEYNQYTYKYAFTVFFPKPFAEPAEAPVSIIALDGKPAGYSLFGVMVGMKRETAFKKFRKAGFTRDTVVGSTWYWSDSKGRQLAVEADSKVISVRFGAW